MRPLASGSTSIWMRFGGSLIGEVAGLLAAQACADGEHQIDGLVELLDLRHAVAVQAAEVHRMLLGDRALAVDAVEHGEAEIEQLVHGRTRRGARRNRATASAASPR